MFNLTQHVSNHRPSDPDFQRQLEADPIFQEVQEARKVWANAFDKSEQAAEDEAKAFAAYEAAVAKAKLFESMEDL